MIYGDCPPLPPANVDTDCDLVQQQKQQLNATNHQLDLYLQNGLRLPAHCKALRLRVSQKNGNKQLKQDHVRAINNMRELCARCAVVLCSGGGD